MAFEIDILRTANLLIQQHGEQDATLRAAMRADELLGQGDLKGAAVWRRVIKAIDLLTAEPPADAEVIQH